MFQHILIPLDGSRLSEASLQVARVLAAQLGSRVTLLHVIEQNAPEAVHQQTHLRRPGEAEDYLQRAAKGFEAVGVTADVHVHEVPVGNVARSIVEHAVRELLTDLIITSTHGGGGARRALFGSIAQQVAAESSLPLLLVKPGLADFKLASVLVPLDPDSEHDSGLSVALRLATATGASLDLLSVVPTPTTLAGAQAAAGNLLPTATRAFLDIRAENALQHLHEHVAEFEAQGCRASSSVARGDPASEILRRAEALEADLIILATHGKAGVSAFWARSVAPRVAEKSRLPVLLLPASTGSSDSS